MPTEKLFYQDPRMTSFTAKVLSCVPDKKLYAVTLDRTAFYPEGGGQPTDMGILGGAAVSFVRDSGGEVIHYVDKPLTVGDAVDGTIDADRRKDLTEQHSGEHIFSGLMCRAFHCDNVGFHIGDPFVTIDFNAVPSREEVKAIEEEANRLVRADLPVHIFWPSPEELAALEYRSKKDLSGAVRIVEFPEADICACCGTHVVRTGEVGLIKLVSCEAHRGGVRLEILCGKRALDYVCGICDENRRVSALLSAKENATFAAAERMQKDNLQMKSRLAALEEASIAAKAEQYRNAGPVLIREENMGVDSARRLADAVMHSCGSFCGVLSDCGEDGIRYALGEEGGNLQALCKALNASFNGRGGGKPGFVQGTLHGPLSGITAFIKGSYPDLTIG